MRTQNTEAVATFSSAPNERVVLARGHVGGLTPDSVGTRAWGPLNGMCQQPKTQATHVALGMLTTPSTSLVS